jgi:hypothetical protein
VSWMPTRKSSFVVLAFVQLLSLELVAMTGCVTNGPPPRPCVEASCSISIESVNSALCPPVSTFPRFLYRAKNISARNIIVDVQATIDHNNQPPLSTDTYQLRRRVPGVSASSSGEVDLGCKYERVLDNDHWDEFQFTLGHSCFEGDPGCPNDPTSGAPMPIAAAPVPPSKSCIDSCKANCFKEIIPPGPARTASRKALGDALSTMTPASVNLSGLLPLQCKDRDPIKIQGTEFEEGGASCSQYFDLLPAFNRRVLASLPGRISGKVTRTGKKSEFVFPDPINAPGMYWYSPTDQPIGPESVERLIVSPGLVKIVGARRYCLWLDLGPD